MAQTEKNSWKQLTECLHCTIQYKEWFSETKFRRDKLHFLSSSTTNFLSNNSYKLLNSEPQLRLQLRKFSKRPQLRQAKGDPTTKAAFQHHLKKINHLPNYLTSKNMGRSIELKYDSPKSRLVSLERIWQWLR